MDGYGELSGAIISQAIKDYYSALSEPDSKQTRKQISELEHFFKSDWFENLACLSGSELDGELLINMLKTKVKEESV